MWGGVAIGTSMSVGWGSHLYVCVLFTTIVLGSFTYTAEFQMAISDPDFVTPASRKAIFIELKKIQRLVDLQLRNKVFCRTISNFSIILKTD